MTRGGSRRSRRRVIWAAGTVLVVSMATAASGAARPVLADPDALAAAMAPDSVTVPDVRRLPMVEPGTPAPKRKGPFADLVVTPPAPPAPAPGTAVGVPAVASSGGDGAAPTAAGGAIPEPSLRAYQSAAAELRASDPTCGLDWTVLAGIGKVESNHGRYAGARVGADGVSRPSIIGIPLDGRPGVARIGDTDGGAFDGDVVFDRAVGPMQFIPGTWARSGADGDGDGRKDPHDIDDAALAAARYLCAGDARLSDESGARAALMRYNHSAPYGLRVLGLAAGYRQGTSVEAPAVQGPVVVPATTFTPAPAREPVPEAVPAPAPVPADPPAPVPTDPPAPVLPAPGPVVVAGPPPAAVVDPPAERPSASPIEEPDPEADPVADPEPAPDPSPDPTPSPDPAPSPDPTPSPDPDPAPDPSPEPAGCVPAGDGPDETPALDAESPSTEDCDPDEYAAALAQAIDDARASVGLPPLEVSECAEAAALDRATDLVGADELTSAPLDDVLAACAPAATAAEHLSRGVVDPVEVVAQWLATPDRPSPLLDPALSDLGVSCVRDGDELLCSVLLLRR